MTTTAAPRVNRFERLDAAALAPPTRLDNGWLKVEGRLARVGIQEYTDGRGGVRRELRIPEEVFDAESLASFHLVPVTNRHPPGMLTAQNARLYSVGSVGEGVRRDGDYVVATLMITDADAITAAEAGRSQLSNGYSCELDPTQDPALVAKWGKYDAIQRRIRGNHCALVDAARAGPEARIRLDGDDALAGALVCDTEPPVVSRQAQRETSKMPHKMKIGTFEIEVQDANAQSIIEGAIDAARKEGLSKADAENARADAAEKAKGELAAQLADMKTKHDALDARIKVDEAKTEKCDECGGSGKMDEKPCANCEGKGEVKADHYCSKQKRDGFVARVATRLAGQRAKLLVEATDVLGANAKLDGKTTAEIHREVVAKLLPALKLDGHDDAQLAAFYTAALAGRPAQRSAIETARTVTDAAATAAGAGARNDAAPSDPDAARRAMIQRTLEQNQKK